VVRALDRPRGQRHYGLKSHGIPGTYKLKRDAQAAIDACHDIEDKGAARPDTVGRYAATGRRSTRVRRSRTARTSTASTRSST
jgi:hypothetical protein